MVRLPTPVRRPKLAVTLGDPRGIGPEIVRAALADADLQRECELVTIGPEGCGIDVDVPIGRWTPDGTIADAGRLSGLAITRAVSLVREGTAQGMVTGPIDKAALLAGGYDHPGHTEMLARLTGSRVAMMLASDRLRVVLATTHLPLRAVPDAVTGKAIVDAATITRAGLRDWFGIDAPRIALCALNPHAGDNGRFGDEDQRILAPAAAAARIDGPFPADTVFVRAMRGVFDAVIAPYHDVGMTAIKVAAFGRAVNVTLGLPFPRTSPDHGTALDIAGMGKADASSMRAAIELAANLARRRLHPINGPGRPPGP